MRSEVTVEKLRKFIEALGNAAKGPGIDVLALEEKIDRALARP